MSRIFYKFRSAKDYDTYKLDGGADGIPVWELKREIVTSKRLHKATDFDLLLSNAQTGESYSEDTQIIPRNAQVIVRRVPLGTSKRGGAYNYASFGTTAPIGVGGFGGPAPHSIPTSIGTKNLADDPKVRAMFAAASNQWERNMQEMPNQGVVGMLRQQQKPNNSAYRAYINHRFTAPPPENYVCYRCGQKGHYIQHCPTNSDPAYDKTRVRRTTGIPRSFLKPVETPTIDGNAANQLSPEQMASYLVTPDGSFVVATPNEQEWDRLATFRSLSQPHQPAEHTIPEELRCCKCRNLLVLAVSVPCCGAAFCDDCIMPTLLGNSEAGTERSTKCLVCECEILASRVLPDIQKRNQIAAFLEANSGNAAFTLASNEVSRLNGKETNEQSSIHSSIVLPPEMMAILASGPPPNFEHHIYPEKISNELSSGMGHQVIENHENFVTPNHATIEYENNIRYKTRDRSDDEDEHQKRDSGRNQYRRNENRHETKADDQFRKRRSSSPHRRGNPNISSLEDTGRRRIN